MKITNIKIKSFLGLDYLDIALEKPVLLVSGPNCSGKTSTVHAIRYVLLNDLCRIQYKKDVKSLIKEGAKSGSVELTIDGVTFQRSAVTGHIVSKHPPLDPHPALRYCLDPEAFSDLDANARREFLFRLMGVKMSAADIISQLEARKHPAALVASIATHLRSGFPMAHQHVKERATLLRGEWRGVTKEDYGHVKAESWSSEVPGVNPDDIDRLRTDAATFDTEIGRLQVRRGEIAGRERERKRLIESQSQTRRIAEGLKVHRAAEAECRKKMDALAKEERTARLAVQEAEARTTVQAHVTQGAFFHCPACGAHLAYSRGECKVGEPAPVDVSNEIAQAEATAKQARGYLSKICNNLIAAERELTDAMNEVAHSKGAREVLDQLSQAASDDESESDEEISDLFARATTQRDSALQVLTALETAHTAHENAISTTKTAKALHEEIKALAALAADLAPDGLPAELLAKAMRPINERLRDSAVMAGWSSVSITTDEILIHGRHWDLASASEQWRANAMIAEAIATLSGVKLFVLDQGDILEPVARAQCLTWLSEIAGEMDTVIIMMTLKQPPKNLPDNVQNFWLGKPAPDINLQGSTRGYDD